MAMGLVFGVIQAVLQMSLMSKIPSNDLALSGGLGLLAGCLLGYGCASWIRHHQSKGIVVVNSGLMVIVIIFLVFANYLSSGSEISPGVIPHPCVGFGTLAPHRCEYIVGLFTVIVDITASLFLLIWGFTFEKSIGHRLLYRVPFFERSE
jgi:hypothetical protein